MAEEEKEDAAEAREKEKETRAEKKKAPAAKRDENAKKKEADKKHREDLLLDKQQRDKALADERAKEKQASAALLHKAAAGASPSMHVAVSADSKVSNLTLSSSRPNSCLFRSETCCAQSTSSC